MKIYEKGEYLYAEGESHSICKSPHDWYDKYYNIFSDIVFRKILDKTTIDSIFEYLENQKRQKNIGEELIEITQNSYIIEIFVRLIKENKKDDILQKVAIIDVLNKTINSNNITNNIDVDRQLKHFNSLMFGGKEYPPEIVRTYYQRALYCAKQEKNK